jgi:PAS domain S-box-containing protein
MGVKSAITYTNFNGEIFPFHLYIDETFVIRGAGSSLLKTNPILLGKNFKDFFSFIRPFSVSTNYNSVSEFIKQLFIIKASYNEHLLLRGQMIQMENNGLLFIGSPWFNNIETVSNLGLNLNDFALHDSTTDLLHLLKTRDIVSSDLESITKMFREQNSELSIQKTILDDVVESTNLGTWRWNVQTGETIFNERWAEIIGFTLNELSPTNIDTWLKYAHETDLEMSSKKLEEHFLGKTKNYDVEVRMRHKNGDIIWVRDRGKVIRWTEDGKPLWMYGTHEDITEKKAYQESLIKSKKRAEELAESKDVFLANISHELRNPINIINGLTDLISVENTSQTIQQNLSKIQNASQTLLTLVNDILEFENYNSGNLKIHKSNFDFEKDLLLSLFSYKLSSNKGNKLVINSPQKQIGEIYSDKDRIKQVLFNLLSNADKFTKGGTITISINHTLYNNKENILTISVKDTGIGIKKSEQKKIFERYGRAEEVENNISGSGLGLSIVKSILDALGGIISLKSSYKKGSEFIVEIPLETPQVLAKNKIFKKRKLDYSNYSVLIVDDDEINRLILENFLKRNNIKSESASNGKEAFNFINKKDFDFIFLDLQMPIMDGFECAKKIRELTHLNKRSSNIIALSANVFAEKKIKTFYQGFSGFISKPYDESKIISTINAVVESSRKYNKSLENLFNDKTLINSTRDSLLFQIVELLSLINKELVDENKKLIKDKLHKITPSLFYIREDSLGGLTRELEEKIILENYTNEEIFTKLNLIGVELVKVLGALKIMNCV